MRKKIGFLLMVVGLVLIGIGSYDGFEKFDKELTGKNRHSFYNGLYFASGDSILVTQDDENLIKITLNNETYEFTYNGSYYENDDSGFYIMFVENELYLYKDGERIKTLYKK